MGCRGRRRRAAARRGDPRCWVRRVPGPCREPRCAARNRRGSCQRASDDPGQPLVRSPCDPHRPGRRRRDIPRSPGGGHHRRRGPPAPDTERGCRWAADGHAPTVDRRGRARWRSLDVAAHVDTLRHAEPHAGRSPSDPRADRGARRRVLDADPRARAPDRDPASNADRHAATTDSGADSGAHASANPDPAAPTVAHANAHANPYAHAPAAFSSGPVGRGVVPSASTRTPGSRRTPGRQSTTRRSSP